MKTKTFTLHHIMSGKWFMDMIRSIYWYELDRTRAMKWFDSLKPKPTDEIIQKILNGDAIIKGWTICNKKGCTQCKGKKAICIVVTNNPKFKKELAKQKIWLEKQFYTFGSGEDRFIPKNLVQRWTQSLLDSKEMKFLRRSKVLAYGFKTRGIDYVKNADVEENAFTLETSIVGIHSYFGLDRDEEYLLASREGLLSLELRAYLDNLKFQVIDDYKTFVKKHRKELRDSKAQNIEESMGMRMFNRLDQD